MFVSAVCCFSPFFPSHTRIHLFIFVWFSWIRLIYHCVNRFFCWSLLLNTSFVCVCGEMQKGQIIQQTCVCIIVVWLLLFQWKIKTLAYHRIWKRGTFFAIQIWFTSNLCFGLFLEANYFDGRFMGICFCVCVCLWRWAGHSAQYAQFFQVNFSNTKIIGKSS